MKRYITDSTQRFTQSRVQVQPAPIAPEMSLVKVYPHVTYQPFLGFGAALTEASGHVFARMSAEQREEFLRLCFAADGNRYSLCRVSIQSCDFSLTPRTYLPKRDETLSGFSIDDDWGYVLPLVKEAQRVNPDLQFIASPWSPPAWAKTNRSMKRGGHLRRDCYGLWARMMARTLADYRDAGVGIGRVTIQNEPNAIQTWESCQYNAAQERAFLHDHLKPALHQAGLGHVKTLIWDHNKEGMLDRAAAIMGDDAAAADVDGVAFHWYSGDHFEALRAARELVGPCRELIFSEGCDYYSAGDPGARGHRRFRGGCQRHRGLEHPAGRPGRPQPCRQLLRRADHVGWGRRAERAPAVRVPGAFQPVRAGWRAAHAGVALFVPDRDLRFRQPRRKLRARRAEPLR